MKMGDGLAICRVCLKTSMECVDFEAPLEENESIIYRDVYNSVTHLRAQEYDTFPTNLCYGCASDLKFIEQFVRKARNSDEILRKRIGGHAEIVPQACEENRAAKVDDKKHSKERVLMFEIESLPESEAMVSDNSLDEPHEQCKPEMEHTEHEKTKYANQEAKKRSRKLLLCNICGKTCSQKSSLESHLLKHKGERPYKCTQCDKSYFTKNGLQIHTMTHTEKKIEKKFECTVCGKAFGTAQRLRVHNVIHTGEKNYHFKSFATPFRLRDHIRVHTGERPYECKVCGLKFAQTSALRCHSRIHTGEKPYECAVCGKKFTQNTILKTHMTLHTGKTVKCPSCDKKFSRPSYLILHQREHTGEKPYACLKCPNRYKQKSHLDRHIDTHLGIKHSCRECGKEYSKKSSLRTHMFTHQDQKPFQCNNCSMSFTRRDKLRNHMKKTHYVNIGESTALDDNENSFKVVVKQDSDDGRTINLHPCSNQSFHSFCSTGTEGTILVQ